VTPQISPKDFSLAFRNVLRQRRRAAFALVIIIGGVIALLLAGGFINWLLVNMRESTIRSQLGHVQIVKPGYFEQGIADPYAYLLPEHNSILDTVGGMKGVRAVTPRLALGGLISLNDATLSFVADGVDPSGEVDLSKSIEIIEGKALSNEDPMGIIIGEGLAVNLGAKLGNSVVLLVNTRAGGINAIETTVRGLFRSTTRAYDNVALRLPIATARKLTKVTGATSWVVLIDHTEATDSQIREMQKLIPSAQFELVPWYKLADFYNKTVTLFSQQVGVVKLLIGLIIILSISNTLMMAVMERTGEIGTVMAIGSTRLTVLKMFILEGLILGALGGAGGISGGLLLGGIVRILGGIPMPPPPGMTQGFCAYISITPSMAADSFALAVITTLLASIFPAWKASRMIIVDALRHQR
jgi:putative ABC transport system permease protein